MIRVRIVVVREPNSVCDWLTRKKAAPISAAINWATARVRLGPISAKSTTASASPTALAASASAPRVGNSASHRQWPKIAIGTRNGSASSAKAEKAVAASAEKRTVSVLRGSSGEENSRSRSPRA